MRSLLLVAATVALTVPAGAQQRVARGYRVSSEVAIRVHNLVGVTRVRGWDRDSIAVTAVIPPGGGRFFGGGQGAFAKFGVEGQDGALSGPGAEFVLDVPRTARVWIKSGSATVEVSGIAGEVEVIGVTGPIRLDGSPRIATLETIDGDITVTGDARVVRARTGAGAIDLRGPRVDVSASSVQGIITVVSAGLVSARLETVSGRIEVRGSLDQSGSLEASGHDGGVTLSLPPRPPARFDIATIKGAMTLALPGAPAVPAGSRTARFEIGGGGATVSVRTFSGPIRIDSNPRDR